VPGAEAFIAEITVDFKDLFHTADQQPFKEQFRSDTHVQIDIKGVVMRHKRTRRRTAGNRLHHGRFDFNKAAGLQKRPDGGHHGAASAEALHNFRVRPQVHITLAIPQILIGQAVEFFRRRQQCLGQNLDLFGPDRDFAGFGFA